MNEVSGNIAVTAITPRSATSSTTGNKQQTTDYQHVDKKLDESKTDVPTVENIDQAVTQMNEYFQNEQRDLQFSIDDGTGSTVVKVLDRQSGETIRQIPNEVFLTLAEQALKEEPLRLINTYG